MWKHSRLWAFGWRCHFARLHREFVSALASQYGEATNLVAESRALLDGLKLCINLGILAMDVETDSKTSSKMVIEVNSDPDFLACIGSTSTIS
ncbi:hypothetical protein ACH5RR_013090 [Cinchona calisaya]|uniref:RNase H type-1 domain-containing protein n=1 Tax=Cinchona calisaya TaxID=153742 RepID=A0ABD3A4S5_9GENT